jgi:hypothetical protein
MDFARDSTEILVALVLVLLVLNFIWLVVYLRSGRSVAAVKLPMDAMARVERLEVHFEAVKRALLQSDGTRAPSSAVAVV